MRTHKPSKIQRFQGQRRATASRPDREILTGAGSAASPMTSRGDALRLPLDHFRHMTRTGTMVQSSMIDGLDPVPLGVSGSITLPLRDYLARIGSSPRP